jgi:aerobic-type carbon monoxide dehydrogenase small subunit (CoxS/CutS family)
LSLLRDPGWTGSTAGALLSPLVAGGAALGSGASALTPSGMAHAKAEGGMAIKLEVNGRQHEVEVEPDTPLLWVLRDTLGLTGTKFGCGIAQCGACTVHVDGMAMRSCVAPVGDCDGSRITTIEGLSEDGMSHPLQVAWREVEVPQCGYCQSGQIMAAAALLQENPDPSDDDILASVTNLCRCGTYLRVRRAIKQAAQA